MLVLTAASQSVAGEHSSPLRLRILKITTTLRSPHYLRGGADAPRSNDNGASQSALAFGAEQTLRAPTTTALRNPHYLRGGADAPRSNGATIYKKSAMSLRKGSKPNFSRALTMKMRDFSVLKISAVFWADKSKIWDFS